MAIAFNSSDHSSLGVEVELNLVDTATGGLVSRSTELLDTLATDVPDPRLKHELFECTVEAITGVCDTVAEARADLAGSFDEIRGAAEATGATLICSGTHPFTDWRDLEVSPDDRYHRLLEAMQWPARRLAITGIHYHVGVRSPEKAIAIVNALTDYLPYFLATSSSSPFWHGVDTGMASVRTKIFESLPTAGLPPSLESWADFEDLMDTLVAAEAIATVREIWWDVRPHPDFGTVELRMCDGMPTLTEITALAALAQSLVAWFDSLIDRGYSLPRPRDWLVRQNKWLAARHGTEAVIITDHSGGRIPLTEGMVNLVEELLPVARRLGCAEELSSLRGLVELGSSASRQRRVIAEGGSLLDVVNHLQRELALDQPGV